MYYMVHDGVYIVSRKFGKKARADGAQLCSRCVIAKSGQ